MFGRLPLAVSRFGDDDSPDVAAARSNTRLVVQVAQRQKSLFTAFTLVEYRAALCAPSTGIKDRPYAGGYHAMLIDGIINPQILSLIARVRHTGLLVIADAAFKSWPQVETVDVSLVKGVPTVHQVMKAVLANWKCGEIVKSQEFLEFNGADVQREFQSIVQGIKVTFEPFTDFKARVPMATGIIRTGETMEHGNVILVSA